MGELERANADLAWWRDKFDATGCVVVGWTYRNTAQIRLPSGRYLSVDEKIVELVECVKAVATLPAAQRDMEGER